MKFFAFDRLSKMLVGLAIVLAIIGFGRAYLRSAWFHASDRPALWTFLAVTLSALMALLCLKCFASESHIRAMGLFFQVLGIAVALYTLSDVREKLGQPGIIPALSTLITDSFKSPESPKVGVAAIAEALDSSEAHGTLTVHPTNLDTKERFMALEDQVSKLEARHADDVAALQRVIRDTQREQQATQREHLAGVTGLRDLLVELQTSGLPVAIFGIIWLVMGAILACLSIEISGWLTKLHE